MKRLIFPIVNAIVLAAFFGIVGYYLFDPLPWLLVGIGFGLGVGLLAEIGTRRISPWLYRRRVTLVVLLEIPLMLFVVGPYAFALGMTRPVNTPINGWTPADFGSTYRSVSIPAADGVTLAGWFIPPVDAPGPTVMVLHGSASNRLQSRWHIETLAKAGYGVLTYDQRALGESTGSQQSAGWLDARDVPHVVDWLVEQPEVDPKQIGGVGLSLGAHILLFAGPDEPRLKAFWLDGASIGNVDDLPQAENFAEQFGTLMNQQIERALILQLGTEPPPPFRELIPKLAPRPVVMIVAGLDVLELRANLPYVDVLGENGEQWVIENAHHVGGPRVIPEEYTARMLTFFDTAFNAAASP
jgi:pimeloyl-ACP methyl ester carboxylesterase